MDELASPSARREQRRRAALDGAGGEGGAEPGRNSRNRALSDALDQGPGNSSPEPPTSTVSPPERTQLQQASRRRPSLLTSPTASRDGEPASPMGRMRRGQAARRRGAGPASHDSGSERSFRMGRGGHREGQQSQEPVRPQGSANLHVIGEIAGASGFARSALYCRWQLMYEPTKTWALLRGMDKGATQVCSAAQRDEEFVVWDHPLDMQLMMQTVQGWPCMVFMVYARNDGADKDEFVSYGLAPLPKNPGIHHIKCQTWFAVETNQVTSRRLFSWFTGMNPRMEDEGFVLDTEKRADAGPFVCTVGAGCVHLRLQVLIKDPQHLHYLSGQSLFAALEKVRHALEKKNRRDLTKIANMKSEDEEDEKKATGPQDSEGLRHMRQGREARMEAAQKALEGRRSKEPSLAGSFTERSQSAEPRRSNTGALRMDSGSLSAPRERRPSGQPASSTDRLSGQGPLGERPSSMQRSPSSALTDRSPSQQQPERASGSSSATRVGGGGAGTAVAESADAAPPPSASSGPRPSRATPAGGRRRLGDKLDAAATASSGPSASEDEGSSWTLSKEELEKRQAVRQARRAAVVWRR